VHASAVLENATRVIEGEARSAKAFARLAAAVESYRARGIAVDNRLRSVEAVATAARVPPGR
jgi:hypothetical protein